MAKQAGLYRRDDLEFGRVVAFSDAVFAIAMTLLTVGITLPILRQPDSTSELLRDLNELQPEIISFFVSFTVIGFYWLAHHRFVASLVSVDNTLVALHLPYLAFIALLPFPTSMLGRYDANPVALASYALVVAVISTLEWVMFRHARADGHLRQPISQPAYLWATATSLTPSVLFLASAPLAFWSPVAAYAMWAANLPAQVVLGRLRPADAESWLG